MIPSYSLAPVFGISISEQRKIYFNHRNTLISLLSNTLIDKQGYIRAFSPLQPGVIDARLTSPSHAATVQANTFFISQPYVSLIGNLIVYISVPIHNAEGEQLGYVGGSIYLNNRNATNEFMNSQFDDDNYDTYVLNKDGTIIYHHDKSRIGQKIDDNSLKQMALLGNKGNFRLTDSQGATFLAGFAKVKRADWIILTLQTEQIVTQALNNVMIDVIKKSAPGECKKICVNGILRKTFRGQKMPISNELIDQLLQDCHFPQELLGESGLLKQLTKRLAERVLQAEMEIHLGYAKHDPAGNHSGNSRNGKTSKSVRSQNGALELDIPRDRNSTFEPTLIGKHEKQLNGFDDRIISLYSRGLSTRDIQAHFKEVYGVDVSAGFIYQVTNAVMDDVKRWQQRPLDAFYPIVYLDCIVVKSQDGGAVTNKSVYLALGINGQGEKELLGLWIAKTEGAKFWLSVMTELKNRGLQDIFIACCDGLKGFPDAIEAVYPHTRVQLCIVHQVRNSLRYVGWKERKAVAADLRTIYSSATLEGAEEALDAFAAKWDEQFPTISPSWRNNWERLIVIFDFPPEIRKVIYTTNAPFPLETQQNGRKRVA